MAANRHDLMRAGMPFALAHLLGTDGRNGAATMSELAHCGLPPAQAKLLGSNKPPPPGTPARRDLIGAKMPAAQAKLLGV